MIERKEYLDALKNFREKNLTMDYTPLTSHNGIKQIMYWIG